MSLSLSDLAGVVGPGDWIAQGREGRQEQRTLELFISASGRQITANGSARASCNRRQPCLGSQVGCRNEGAAATSIRSLAVVPPPTPGMLIRTG